MIVNPFLLPFPHGRCLVMVAELLRGVNVFVTVINLCFFDENLALPHTNSSEGQESWRVLGKMPTCGSGCGSNGKPGRPLPPDLPAYKHTINTDDFFSGTVLRTFSKVPASALLLLS